VKQNRSHSSDYQQRTSGRYVITNWRRAAATGTDD